MKLTNVNAKIEDPGLSFEQTKVMFGYPGSSGIAGDTRSFGPEDGDLRGLGRAMTARVVPSKGRLCRCGCGLPAAPRPRRALYASKECYRRDLGWPW